MWMWQAENWMNFFLCRSFAVNSLWVGPVLFLVLIKFWFQSCNNWFIKILNREKKTWRSWTRWLLLKHVSCTIVMVIHLDTYARTYIVQRKRKRERERSNVIGHRPSDGSLKKKILIFQWVIDYRWSNLSTSFQVYACFVPYSLLSCFLKRTKTTTTNRTNIWYWWSFNRFKNVCFVWRFANKNRKNIQFFLVLTHLMSLEQTA